MQMLRAQNVSAGASVTYLPVVGPYFIQQNNNKTYYQHHHKLDTGNGWKSCEKVL